MPKSLFTKGVIWSIVSLQIGVSHMGSVLNVEMATLDKQSKGIAIHK